MKQLLVYRISLGFWMAIELALISASSIAQAAPWPYDPLYEPISRQEVIRIFRDPKSSFGTKRLALARAGVNGLLEVVVVECSNQLKKKPQDPILRGFYCYALFIAHDPSDYTPHNKKEWLRQRDLFVNATIQAEDIVREKGASLSFCWQALAYVNLQGIAGGVPLGIERAEKALQLAPRDPFAHRLLASAYLKSGSTQDLNKALKYANQAVLLQAKSERPYSYQAQAFFLQKNYIPAYAALKKAYARRPPKYRDPMYLSQYAAWARHQASINASKTKK